jgi:hypothetical protein
MFFGAIRVVVCGWVGRVLKCSSVVARVLGYATYLSCVAGSVFCLRALVQW